MLLGYNSEDRDSGAIVLFNSEDRDSGAVTPKTGTPELVINSEDRDSGAG
jgi:hypothetical protein